MSNVTIFEQKDALTNTGRRPLSDLTKSVMSTIQMRRIQTNTNGTFKRIINGEQVGNAVRGEVNVIIVGMLAKVSRIYYAGKYDPDAKPTLPNCWSNLGDKPEAAASDKQGANCGSCPKNVDGSGENGKGRACRFQRRIAVILEGDDSGDIYQFNIPAKSLFGKGVGNTHPYESYIKFLPSNGFSIDGVVTKIAYDLNADSMQLLFRPVRETSDAEFALVEEVKTRPEVKQYTMLTVAQTDKVELLPSAAKAEVFTATATAAAPEPAPKANSFQFGSDEPEEEVVAEPVKRQSKKVETPVEVKRSLADVVSAWGDEDE